MEFYEILGYIISALLILSATAYIFLKHKYLYWKRCGIKYLEPKFPFGNLGKSFMQKVNIAQDYGDLYKQASEPYIGIFGVFRPILLVRDPKLVRDILVKDFQYFVNRGVHYDDKDPLSWFASIILICQPIGSIFSSLITDPLGRKRALFIVNVPHIIAWLMMYKANSILEIFIGNILLGLGVGLMEAPTNTYVGEIGEPSIRGILIAFTNISASLGTSSATAGLVCLFVPIVTMIAVCFV